MTDSPSHLSRTGAMRLLLAAAAALLLAACASMGRPQGGPRDEDPPVFVRSNPMPSQLNVDRNKIEVIFDENVQLDDPVNKIVVSPAQRNQPIVNANGRKITVELRDTLLPNTTYTIDFADAISDLNEKNLLDGFAIDFSTGPTIDSLRISGIVLDARTLEPAQGMIVGAYSNLSDTAIATLPMERITKTNQLGQFTLRNLKEGTYRIFALNDRNRDYHWDRSEDVAFFDTLITPTAERVEVTDTVAGAGGADSLVRRTVTRFLPNDVLLTWFNENYRAQYLVNNKRTERNLINFILGAPTDTLPSIRAINGPRAGADILDWTVLEASYGLDTLNYWISDPAVIAFDSLMVEARYQKLDSLDRLTWVTDTMRMFSRPVRPKKADKKKENDTVPKIEFFNIDLNRTAAQELNRGLTIVADAPIARLDTAAIRLQMLVDTVWTDIAPPRIDPQPRFSNKRIDLSYDWEGGQRYRLTVDSASIHSIYGLFNRPINAEFTVKKAEDYSTLFFNIQGLDGRPAMVELLGGNDEVVMAVPATDGRATFTFVTPGTYYARLYIDANGNGEYDTGNLAGGVQPEEVYYYNRKLNLKKNWDIEQSWSIYELPLDVQKPFDIKKNKPKLHPDTPDDTEDDEHEDDDPYTDPYFRYDGYNRYQ